MQEELARAQDEEEQMWILRMMAEELRHGAGAGADDPVAVDIQHVGSTSVPGLAAKPTIDIAIGVVVE